MTVKKSRGRPKSAATIERERIEAMFKNKPAWVRDDGFTKQLDCERSKQIEAELIADFPRSIPHRLIFAANSDYEDPESETKVQSLMAKSLAATAAGQTAGAGATKEKALSKAQALWAKNQDLIPRMQTPGLADMVAQKILKAWATRGIAGSAPSVNTIKNWFKIYIDN